MEEWEVRVVMGICGLLVGVIFSTVLGVSTIDGNWREAISRGYAEYCPQTDTFEWNGDCK